MKPLPYTQFPPPGVTAIHLGTSEALLLHHEPAIALVQWNRHDGHWYHDPESMHVFTKDAARALMIALGEALR